MRKFLIIVPDPAAQAGLVGETLVNSGAEYDAILPTERYATQAPFAYPGIPQIPGDYAGLIVLGGPMSANDEAEFPFLGETMELIHKFDHNGKPVLGICLGAQIISRAYGGEVYRMDKLESGFRTMELTAEGRADPIFSELGDDVTSFQNHFEAVRNIPDAVPLATGGACPIQAYRLGEKVYATQFHPEVTLDIVRDWIRKFGRVFTDHEPRLLTDLDRQFREFFPCHRAQCETLVRRWMALAPA
ncbi:MAG TPA: type 1 glutamine amidotransferase [Dongiaceae bacterium]|nr:type 1 glutamine amidotransferase [Dongiaceae bacterium]